MHMMRFVVSSPLPVGTATGTGAECIERGLKSNKSRDRR